MAVDQAIPAVLFVLGLIYIGLLVIAFFRTYKLVFRKGPRSESHKVFIGFYTFMWVVLTLTISLYMVAGQPFGRGLEQRFNASIVVLYFLPTILMVLAYVLLYQQLELLMTESRIPTSGSYRNKEKKEKLAKCGRIAANIVISLFLITELVLMFISLLSFISIRAFYETLYISFIVVIISMNLNMTIVYFKLVGSPYKSTEHYEKIR